MKKVRTTSLSMRVLRAPASLRRPLCGLTALLMAQFPFTLPAQTAYPGLAAITDTARLRLQPLKWLIGEWSGPATGTNSGYSYSVTQHENVMEAANGTALIIQGRGTMEGRTTFEAAGILTYDMGSRQFKLASSGGVGYFGVNELQVKGDTIVWSTPSGPTSRTRYTIWRSPKGEWREVGEETKDSQTWTRVLDMTLVKK